MAFLRRTLFGDVDIEARAIQHIQTFAAAGCHVANSGGKDSGVLRHLFLKAGTPCNFHYNWTTVDPPELLKHIEKNHKETVIYQPKLTMWQLIPIEGMPPTRKVRYCCRHLKESFRPGGLIALGVRWGESRQRSNRCLYEQDRNDTGTTFFNPIIDWTENEIWQYTYQEKIPFCGLYNKGCKRIGCIACPMKGLHGMKRDLVLFPKHRAAYVRSFQRMLDVRHQKGLKTEWTDGEDVMKWWVTKKAQAGHPDQSVLFD